jgi:hypothetical protein
MALAANRIEWPRPAAAALEIQSLAQPALSILADITWRIAESDAVLSDWLRSLRQRVSRYRYVKVCPMIDLNAAKRLMLTGASDLDVSTRRTIAAGRWPEGPSGWQCAGLFLHVMEQTGWFDRNASVGPC